MNATNAPETPSRLVTELAIRRLHPSQEAAAFAQARDGFVDLLRQQPGVRTDREFSAFLDFTTFAPPTAAVWIGMTQYDDASAFAAAGAKVGSAPETGAFFSTFDPVLFTTLLPLNPEDSYVLADIGATPGQVLEVAYRDLSAYPQFIAADYDAKRNAFLAALREQPGFVAEYQWVSTINPNIVAGMTVYESGQAFESLAMSPFSQSEVSAQFVARYPPAAGYACVDARG